MPIYTLKRFYNELKSLDLKTIEKDIPNLKIKVNKIDNLDLEVIFKFVKQYSYFNFPDLPLELNRLIHYFNKDYIILNIRIIYPQLYPLQPPKWHFINLKTNFSKLIIELYLKYNISLHNCLLSPNRWNPAITIEKDLLSFLSEINIFNDLIKKNVILI